MRSVEQEWFAVIERIEALAEASRLSRPGSEGGANATGRFLLKRAVEVFDDLKRMAATSESSVSPGVISSIRRAQEWVWPDADSDQSYSRTAITQLAVLAGELRYHLRDREAGWSSIVERAFLHLNRTLVVDDEARRKWGEAFGTPRIGETKCEALGGVHLLAHGIWAFKAHTREERTDLVLHEPIIDITAREKRAVEALVHTEWKLVREEDSVADKFREARVQAKVYGAGVLAGFELASVRYCVTVGMKYAAAEPDVTEGGVIYRHIHVSIERQAPSRISARD